MNMVVFCETKKNGTGNEKKRNSMNFYGGMNHDKHTKFIVSMVVHTKYKKTFETLHTLKISLHTIKRC